MGDLISKKNMTEEDIKFRYITPAIVFGNLESATLFSTVAATATIP